MNKIQIFVEGVADQKFLQDIIEEWYGITLTLGKWERPSGNIISLDGKTAFDSPEKMKKLIPIFQQLAVQEIPAIVIFDADIFPENQQHLLAHSQTHSFRFFLLPNNKADGDLETLLHNLIHPENQVIFDCWENYEQCLQGQQTTATDSGEFTLPARKTKIYAYLEALVGETKSEKDKIKESNRDYRNPKHWNLDPSHPPLKPLKEFLDPFFLVHDERAQ